MLSGWHDGCVISSIAHRYWHRSLNFALGKPNDSCKENQQHDTYAIHGDLRYAQPGRPRHDICCDGPPGYPTNQAELYRWSMSRTALYHGPATEKLCTYVSAWRTVCSEMWCCLPASNFHTHITVLSYRSLCFAARLLRTQCCTLRNTVPDHSSD